MLYIRGHKSIALEVKRISSCNRQILFSARRYLADTPIPKPPSPPTLNESGSEGQEKRKKKFSFFKLLFNTVALGSIAYGGTLYAATKNEKVMDFVIDKQLPLQDEIIEFFEQTTWEDVKNKLNVWKEYATNLEVSSADKVKNIGSKLEGKSESFISETKKRLGSSEKTQDIIDAKDAPLPADQLQKPVEVETVKKQDDVNLVEVGPSTADPIVKDAINSLNEIIKYGNLPKNAQSEKLIKAVEGSITELNKRVKKLSENFEDELDAKLKASQTELLSSYTQKELDLTSNLLYQFNSEKEHLDKKYAARLKEEVEASKQALSQAAVNAISMVRYEQTKNFDKLVKDKVDSERNGRLANLDKLNEKLSDLEKFASNLETQISNSNNKVLVQKALNNFKNAFNDNNTTAKSLQPQLDNLVSVADKTNNEVFKVALADLKPLIAGESSKSILTTSQLLTRWEQLTPELRSSSLLPPNAGLLGHFASRAFSKLLFQVKGSKPDGRDIESVIGRVESSLTRGDLDVAVEEVANLKGWPRKLANDWLLEGRKTLEVRFLVDVIQSEALIL